MPFNPECTTFNGEICLNQSTLPYSVICSGVKFGSRNAMAQRISPESFRCITNIWNEYNSTWNETDPDDLIWNTVSCSVRDFMEERTPFVGDEMCSIHPIAMVNYERDRCENRFGWARYQEIGNPTNKRFRYDETCVGYKTTNTGETPLDHQWVQVSLGFFKGNATYDNEAVPNGPCLSHENPIRQAIRADPSQCGGFFPCHELLEYQCQFDSSTPSPVDPNCPTGEPLPPSLLQEVKYCATNPDASANHKHHLFCSTDRNTLVGAPIPTARFCSANNPAPFEIDDAKYCSTAIDNLRIVIQKVSFCNHDSQYIRPEVNVENVKFCSYDRTIIETFVPSVSFCSIDKPIGKANFCAFDDTTIRNVGKVGFCEYDDANIRASIDEVGFCENFHVPVLKFCAQDRLTIDGAGLAAFCEYDRTQIDGAQEVGFCDSNELIIKHNALFCSTDRSTIDGATNVTFCSLRRSSIDNIPDLDFCSMDRSVIDGADKVAFCEQNKNTI